jgi:hypothetical protein
MPVHCFLAKNFLRVQEHHYKHTRKIFQRDFKRILLGKDKGFNTHLNRVRECFFVQCGRLVRFQFPGSERGLLLF